ncbi:MAG: LysM peptidoglycan-binding domain-containing protein [Myxococcota bacterium]|nr:LysM peptidoglycan-binding domain-containing protein [Myxococcota bacterium]
MRLRQDDALFRFFTALFFALTTWAIGLSAWAAGPVASSAKTQKDRIEAYEIKPGDTLRGIAFEHGVDVNELMALNEITNADSIFAGHLLKLPHASEHGKLTKNGVVLNVPKGFTLSRIGSAYGVSVSAIVRANRLENPDRLREGQQLLIPGAKKVVVLVPPPPCFQDPVTLYRIRNDKSVTVPLCFCSGKPNPAALDALSKLSGPVGKKTTTRLNARLLLLLQRIAKKYPGKRIEIVSGYRPKRQVGNESYHTKARALDFRVEGISNRTLVSYLRTFDRVGVGYYPNSVFIHLDTRDKKAYWIDYSRPGEKAIYGRASMTKKDIEAIRKHRQEKQYSKLKAQARAAVSKTIASLSTRKG